MQAYSKLRRNCARSVPGRLARRVRRKRSRRRFASGCTATQRAAAHPGTTL